MNLELGIYYYKDDNGNKVYDLDAIGDELADKLRNVTKDDVEVIITSNGKQTWENR
jgi:hypothetical protein